MITINRLKVLINAHQHGRPVNQKFGFNHAFVNGLNVLTGENTSGKSTILSSIYFGLGLEQILGGNRVNILDQSLTTKFKHNEQDYGVASSWCAIKVTNASGIEALLIRQIVPTTSGKTIEVRIGDASNTYFLHAPGDSDFDKGFYNWFAEFIGIKIPTYIDDDGNLEMILYLQQIFAACFVEQSKGWSDYFAQLPYFKTSSPKSKIVEYLLELGGLVNDYRLDLLKDKHQSLLQTWKQSVNNFTSYAITLNFKVGGLSSLSTNILTEREINKLELSLLKDNDDLQSIEDVRSFYIAKLRELEEAQKPNIRNSNPERILERSEVYVKRVEEWTAAWVRLNEKRNIELEKLNSYKKIIAEHKEQIQLLEGEKRTANLLNITSGTFDHCPLCNQEVSADNTFDDQYLQHFDSDQSIAYYKNEVSLYQSYINKATHLLADYKGTELYIYEQLEFSRLRLEQLQNEMTDDVRLPSRTIIAEQVANEFELRKIEILRNSFGEFKATLIELGELIAANKAEIDTIEGGNPEDLSKVLSFRAVLRSKLRDFGYSSNDISNIEFTQESAGIFKLLPFINYAGSRQTVRLSSSASDFIRSIWAFYLSLLEISKLHPGFLVMDEPGQHAMSLTSMQTLIKDSISIKGRQIILAISNDKLKQSDYTVQQLLSEIPDSDVHLINIPGGQKSVAPISD